MCSSNATTFCVFFFLLRPPPTSTLFPYTTLFRSCHEHVFVLEVDPQVAIGMRIAQIAQFHLPVAELQTGIGVDERSEEYTSELQSRENLVCRLLLEKKKKNKILSRDPRRTHATTH